MKITTLSTVAALITLSSTTAFLPSKVETTRTTFVARKNSQVGAVVTKPSGTSFLPEETVERCKVGSPIEKFKIEKDATAAWVDVYEYARKIREGEMTWEEVEKSDLDNVSDDSLVSFEYYKNLYLIMTFPLFSSV
jgi:hypothetical protein